MCHIIVTAAALAIINTVAGQSVELHKHESIVNFTLAVKLPATTNYALLLTPASVCNCSPWKF